MNKKNVTLNGLYRNDHAVQLSIIDDYLEISSGFGNWLYVCSETC